MKRARTHVADAPRLNALASCLATALALGTGALVPTCADANVPPPVPTPASHSATAVLPTLSAAERDMIMNAVNAAVRTPPPVPATNIPVTNCNDSGAGSLRDAVNSANDGDTIDMTSLACSTITLTSGAISIGVNNLTLQGPGILSLEVSGNDAYRVFWHLGTGTLTVNDMIVSHGKKYLNDGDLGNAGGACLFSAGSLAMNNTWAKYCDAGSNDVDSPVHGGAVYATNSIVMGYSLVTASSAHSSAFQARGGGVYTPGQLFMLRSTVSGNTAGGVFGTGGGVQVGSVRPEGSGGTPGGSAGVKYSSITGNSASFLGGGAYFTGDAAVGRSTISGNQSCRAGGLYFVNSANVTQPASLYSSTVANNSAACTTGGAGVAIWSRNSLFKDTTIAFNTTHSGGTTKYGAGVRMPNANSIDLQNTIIASNYTDFGSGPLADDIGGGGTLTGANNLVYFPSSMVTPGGTILLTDPMLRALANNGGPTSTLMPNYGSPVIDVGNNASGATVDQRGSGHPRVLGPAADIGAVEFDLPDSIFANGFD
ncbi:choice-of-anchor Q domain-containing protein [Dokdonella sp.]|uniref:choice-of-anchor Q domain-containing protein n=1 Tax=Dokdonella sp. TaxID=2291710 RepID=UPI002F42BC20